MLSPPLGIDTDAWVGERNPIDAYFAYHENEMTVIRRESVGDVQTYVLEHKDEHELPPNILSKELAVRFPGKLQLYAITTAWVDATRGFLPLRIEKTGAFFYEDRRLGPPPQLAELLTILELRKIEGGGWYPTKGRVDSFNQDPEWTNGQNSIEMLLTNHFHNIPHVVVSTASWTTQHIETVLDTTDLFKFDFPNDTEYYDEKSNQFLFKGAQQVYVDKVLSHQNTTIALKSKILRILALLGFDVAVFALIVMVCIVCVYGWHRTRRLNR